MAEEVNTTVHKQALASQRLQCLKTCEGVEVGMGPAPKVQVQVVITSLSSAERRRVRTRGGRVGAVPKCDSTLHVAILIKAKGCFGALSSAENFILGAKKTLVSGPRRRANKSDIMFGNIACKQQSTTCVRVLKQLHLTSVKCTNVNTHTTECSKSPKFDNFFSCNAFFFYSNDYLSLR